MNLQLSEQVTAAIKSGSDNDRIKSSSYKGRGELRSQGRENRTF